MGKHEKPVSGASRKSEARLPRAERTPSVREEELLFDIPETAERVITPAPETLPEAAPFPFPAQPLRHSARARIPARMLFLIKLPPSSGWPE